MSGGRIEVDSAGHDWGGVLVEDHLFRLVVVLEGALFGSEILDLLSGFDNMKR